MSEEQNIKIDQNSFFNEFNKKYRDVDTMSHSIFFRNNDENINMESIRVDYEYDKNSFNSILEDYPLKIKSLYKSQKNLKQTSNSFFTQKSRSKSSPKYILIKKNSKKKVNGSHIKKKSKLKIKQQLKNLFRLYFCSLFKDRLKSFIMEYNINDYTHLNLENSFLNENFISEQKIMTNKRHTSPLYSLNNFLSLKTDNNISYNEGNKLHKSAEIKYKNKIGNLLNSDDDNTISNDSIILTYSNSEKIKNNHCKKNDENNKENHNLKKNKLINEDNLKHKKSKDCIINNCIDINKNDMNSNLFIKPKISYINYVDETSNEGDINNNNYNIKFNSKSNKKYNQDNSKNSKNSCKLVSFSKNNVYSSGKSNSNTQFSFRDLLTNKNSKKINISNFKDIEHNLKNESNNSINFSSLISPSKNEKNKNEQLNLSKNDIVDIIPKEKYNSYPLDDNYNKQINDICNNSLQNLYFQNNNAKIDNFLNKNKGNNDYKIYNQLVNISEDYKEENKNIGPIKQHNNKLNKNNDVFNRKDLSKISLNSNSQKEYNDKVNQMNKKKKYINCVIDNCELLQIKNDSSSNSKENISFNNLNNKESDIYIPKSENYYLKYEVLKKSSSFILRFLYNDTDRNAKFKAKIKLSSYLSIIQKIRSDDNYHKILNDSNTQISIRSYNNFIKNLLDKTSKIKLNNDSESLLDNEIYKKMKFFDKLIKEYKKTILSLLIKKHYIQSIKQKSEFILKNNKQLINKQNEIKKYYNELLSYIKNNKELIIMILNTILNYKKISIYDVKNAKKLYKIEKSKNKSCKISEVEKETKKERNNKLINYKSEKIFITFCSVMITFSYILNYLYKNQKDSINK